MTQTARYQLNSVANITQAEKILADFRELFVLGQPVELDASEVERIDTAVLQLIVSLKKSLADKELALTFSAASDAFSQAVNTMGLTHILEFSLTDEST